MNQLVTTPDVKLFVAAVREHLADLSDDEREELVGGLEGDMSDLVAERGAEALPEPAAYAVELRAAAGFDPVAPVVARPALGLRVSDVLDAAHDRWDALVTGLPGRPWELLVALRPVWWVFRAWLALSLLDLLWGRGSTGIGLGVVPSLGPWSWPLLVVAVVGSVLVGLGRVWPGRGGAGGRVVLLLLNALALLVAPVCLTGYTSAADVDGWYGGVAGAATYSEGLVQDGRQVTNIQAYDAEGRPLVGVQLLDQRGEPLRVPRESWDEDAMEDVRLTPWRAGLRDVPNVFPMPERRTDNATGAWSKEPELPAPPVASLPPVALDGVVASRVATPSEVRALERLERRERARR